MFHPQFRDLCAEDDGANRLYVMELFSRVYWTGNFLEDFWCFLKLRHPLIGIFAAPANHAISQKERIWILLSGICMSLASALVVMKACKGSEEICFNDCSFANDTVCNDRVIYEALTGNLCEWGHDCADCGMRGGQENCTTEFMHQYGKTSCF